MVEPVAPIVWTASAEGAFTFLSVQWSEVTGLSNTQGLGFEFLQAINPEDQDGTLAQWQQSVQGHNPYEAKFRLRQASGTYRWVVARAQLKLSYPAEWVGTFADIEATVQAESQQIKSDQFLAALLDNLSDGIVACDANGTLTLFNAASQAFHGLPAEPVGAEQWSEYYDLYYPDGQTRLRQEDIPLFRALKGEFVRGAKMKIVPKQGTPRLLIASGTPILDPSGQQVGAVVAMRDITEQERAEAELQQLNVELEQRVAQRSAELESINHQNIALLASERQARSEAEVAIAEAEAAITQLELTNCQYEDLLEREQKARADVEAAIAQTQTYTERLSLAVNAAKLGLWDLDWATCKVIWSPYHELIFGYPPGQPERDYFDWERRVHPDDLEWIHKATHAARDSGEDLTLQYRIIWPDGSLHWVNALGRFYYNSDGAPIRMIGVVTDVTDSKQAEQALAESEARYRSLVEATSQIIWNTNAQGEVIAPQQGWGRFTGQTFNEYKGWGWLSAIHPEDRARTQMTWAEAVANQTLYSIEHQVQRADGEYRHMQVKAILILAEDGTVREWVGTHTDITEQKHYEQALRQSQEQFRATFEQAAVGIAHVDLDGRWLRVNQKLCEIVGYTTQTLTEITFQDITHPDDLEKDLSYLRQLLAGEIQTYSMEKRYIHQAGHLVWIELTVSLVREESEIGTPKYFISVVEEIGERKRSETDRRQAQVALQERARELSSLNRLFAQAAALLEERNQELDRFVHIVSHDLKAPLRAISNLSEWIEEDLENKLSHSNQTQMQLLRSRVRRMETMINGLLDYARAGRADVRVEQVAVKELLLEVIDSLAPPATFTITVTDPMPILHTKRLLLSQVFANLIGNGIKHHHRTEGTLQISCQDQGEHYEFKIADDGPGIAPQYHDKIFTIFQTVASTHQQDSSGIGLSIVKKIIETEEGTIRLESQLGKGTAFYFTWPKT